MNNLDERYMTYNPKDKVSGNARVCYSEGRQCYIAPGRIKITERQAERLLAKMAELIRFILDAGFFISGGKINVKICK